MAKLNLVFFTRVSATQIYKFDVKFECKFSAPFCRIFNILIFLLRGKRLELRSASSSQRECVLTVANKVRLRTRRSKTEAKELPFSFFGRGRDFTSPTARNCEQTYLRSVYSYERSGLKPIRRR